MCLSVSYLYLSIQWEDEKQWYVEWYLPSEYNKKNPIRNSVREKTT